VAELVSALRGNAPELDAPAWMSAKELAALIRVSLTTLRTWRISGSGPRWSTLGERVRYARADVTAWLASVGGRRDPRTGLTDEEEADVQRKAAEMMERVRAARVRAGVAGRR
jgi:excisionase family DNA binding protein